MRSYILFIAFFGTAVAPALAQGVSPIARSWDSVAASLPSDRQSATRIINEKYRGVGIPLLYWPKKGIPDSLLTGLDVGVGPCGAVILAQSPRIPPSDDRLMSETVFEVDATGRILHKWPVPLNASPLRLRGDVLEILVPVGFTSLVLAVQPGGQYVVVPAERTSNAQVVDCPAKELFPSSDYVRCLQLVDSGRRRQVAYQAPCT